MNATMVASGTKTEQPAVSAIQDIPLENIRESNSNPRRVFDETQLRELAANIQTHGVLQAALLRPPQEPAAGGYELLAGTPPFLASRLGATRTRPATVPNSSESD